MLGETKICISSNAVRIIGSFLCLLGVILGGILSGSAVYILIIYEYIIELFARHIFFGGVYGILSCGISTVLSTTLSFYNFTHMNRFTAFVASVLLLCTVLVLGPLGFIVYMYPKTMSGLILDSMKKTLPNYGHIPIVTIAWDILQSYLRCCAIDNQGWFAYNQSIWFKQINQNLHYPEKLIPRSSPFYLVVPVSCCSTLIDPITGFPTSEYRDVKRCQTWQYGPPLLNSGPHNDALYYRGCYSLLLDYMNLHVKYIFGLSLAVTILLIIIFTLLVTTQLSDGQSSSPFKKQL